MEALSCVHRLLNFTVNKQTENKAVSAGRAVPIKFSASCRSSGTSWEAVNERAVASQSGQLPDNTTSVQLSSFKKQWGGRYISSLCFVFLSRLNVIQWLTSLSCFFWFLICQNTSRWQKLLQSVHIKSKRCKLVSWTWPAKPDTDPTTATVTVNHANMLTALCTSIVEIWGNDKTKHIRTNCQSLLNVSR